MARQGVLFLWLLSTAALVAVTACTNQNDDKDIAKGDPALKKEIEALSEVSTGLVVIRTSFIFNKSTSCMLSEMYRESLSQKNEPASKEPGKVDKFAERFLTKIKKESYNLCDLFSKVEAEIQPVLDQIRKSRKMPEQSYFFSVFWEKGDDSYDKQEIGPFLSESSCRNMEAFAIERDIPTRRCRPWKEMVWAGFTF